MRSDIISTTSAAISSGGTITGDLTIDGELTVSGTGAFAYTEVVTGDMKITNAYDTTGLEINQTGDGIALKVNQDDADKVALEIDTVITTNRVLYAHSNVLTTGKVGYFYSGGAAGSDVRNIVEVSQAHSGATGATALYINQDSTGSALTAIGAAGSGSAAGAVIKLQTAETSNVDGDYIGRIEFNAPLDASGSDAILAGASIHAEAEENFSATNNSTGLVFSTGTTTAPIERMRINQDGNVGIGIASPSSSLHISGAGNTAATFESTDANCNIIIKDDGSSGGGLNIKAISDVGYFSAGGSTALVIDANSRISLSNNDSSGVVGTTLFGYQAGLNIVSGAIQNTFIGHIAGGAGTITNAADGNTGVGYRSLEDLTQGDNNVAVGLMSGSALTSGKQNTIIGAYSGWSTLLVDEIVCVGYNAGGSAMAATADGTVAIGRDALTALTSGAGNTAVGYSSASLLVEGAYNTVLGYQAFDAGQEDSKCTAIGYQALTAADISDTGSAVDIFNTAVGYQAGVTSVTGTHNTFIGALADGESTSVVRSNVLGHNVSGADDCTTLGEGTNDIRANHGSTTWATVSDERFKKDIETSTAGLSFVNDLRPITYYWKSKGDVPDWSRAYEEGSEEQFRNAKQNHGFIAQEVKVVIDAHSEIKDGFSMWSERSGSGNQQEVGEAALIPILVKAVQELSAKVEALENA